MPLKLTRKLLKKYGFVPDRMIADDLRSYGAAAHDLGIERHHERGRWKNNRAENSRRPNRRRARKMQRFRSPGSAQKFLSPHAAVYNIFNVQRRLAFAQTHRAPRRRGDEDVTQFRRGPLIEMSRAAGFFCTLRSTP